MCLIALAAPSLPEAQPLELIDAAAAAGFGGVGLRLCRSRLGPHTFHPVIGNSGLMALIRRRLADSGIKLLDIYTFYLTSDFDFSDCHAAMEVGAELGAKYAAVVGHATAGPEMLETFVGICDTAQNFGLTVSIEFAPQLWPSTLAQALALLRDSGRANVALMPDPSHFLRSGATLAELRSVDRKYLRYSQLCDVEIVGEEFLPNLGRVVPKTVRRLPGEGIVPFAEWFDALPPGLPVSAECTPPPRNMSHGDWAKAVYASTRRAVDMYYSRAGRPS